MSKVPGLTRYQCRLVFIGSLAVHSICLHRHRAAGLRSTPVPRNHTNYVTVPLTGTGMPSGWIPAAAYPATGRNDVQNTPTLPPYTSTSDQQGCQQQKEPTPNPQGVSLTPAPQRPAPTQQPMPGSIPHGSYATSHFPHRSPILIINGNNNFRG
jgi:hypothetical protein